MKKEGTKEGGRKGAKKGLKAYLKEGRKIKEGRQEKNVPANRRVRAK
jgi:hypothetical protein